MVVLLTADTAESQSVHQTVHLAWYQPPAGLTSRPVGVVSGHPAGDGRLFQVSPLSDDSSTPLTVVHELADFEVQVCE